MKNIILFGIICTLFSCQSKVEDHSNELQVQIDSLKSQLSKSYKPDFGDFMLDIQMHHIKLWFAAKKRNWKLAEFEMNVINENLDKIQKYSSNRVESQLISMINPGLDSISKSIDRQDFTQFKKNYILLSNTCIKCHRETNHEFIQVQVPEMDKPTNEGVKLEK